MNTPTNSEALPLTNCSASSPFGCKCQTLTHHLLGDGCDQCNPEFAEELRQEYAAQLAEDIREEQAERMRGINSLPNETSAAAGGERKDHE